MFEGLLPFLLEDVVDPLKLIAEFDLSLHQLARTQQHILDLLLAVDLLDLDTTEFPHPVQSLCPFIDQDAKQFNARVRRQQHDQIRG